jgi:hypothetical protein
MAAFIPGLSPPLVSTPIFFTFLLVIFKAFGCKAIAMCQKYTLINYYAIKDHNNHRFNANFKLKLAKIPT